MEPVVKLNVPFSVCRNDTNFKICLVCQQETSENLVLNPKSGSLHTLLESISKRSEYRDSEFPALNRQLQPLSSQLLKGERKANWHRSCYLTVTNKKHIEIAKRNYDTRIDLALSPSTSSTLIPTTSTPFTRSQSTPHSKEIYFFCNEPSTIDQKLFRIEREETRISLIKAVDLSSNSEKLKVKLSSAVDKEDAPSIDVRYHKHCWRKYVYHPSRKIEESANIETQGSNRQNRS